MIELCLLAIVSHSRTQDVKEVWDEEIGMLRFRATMSINTFEVILRCLRFDDVEIRKERNKIDKLALISEYLVMFANNCKANYEPHLFITVAEQLYLCKG